MSEKRKKRKNEKKSKRKRTTKLRRPLTGLGEFLKGE